MSDRFIGVQIGPDTLYDEGIDYCLDLLQETAGVNALVLFTHSVAEIRRTPACYADHGRPHPDRSARQLPPLWVKVHEKYFAGTMLRPRPQLPHHAYYGKDVLEDLLEPCRKRGITIHPRILTGGGPGMDNWPKVAAVGMDGQRTWGVCWNNPDFRNYWLAVVEDLFRSYPIDGFKFGAENDGPLSTALLPGGWTYPQPTCFCGHCAARAARARVDMERAREGFAKLMEVRGRAMRGEKVRDGLLVAMIRVVLEYPEVIAWEREWYRAKEELVREIRGVISTIAPKATLGIHIHQSGVSWNFISRAEMDYARIAEYCHWIKPTLYPDVSGPRLHAVLNRTVGRAMSPREAAAAAEVWYLLMGLDPEQEPAYDQLPGRGLSEDYVARETRRCVEAVAGRAKVYAGFGFDIPWDRHAAGGGHVEPLISDPEFVYRCCRRCFAEGADGLLISREYDELTMANLRAVGRAVREARV